MSKKSCKFEDSIIAQMGWDEEEYNAFYWNYLNMKIANNICLTPQETKDFIALGENH